MDPTIGVPLCNLQRTVSSLPYLQSLKLAHPVTGLDYFEIAFLIGADNYWNIVQNRVIRGNGPTAVESKIGYLLSCPLSVKSKQPRESIFNVIASAPELYDLQRFFFSRGGGAAGGGEELESLGISPPKDESSISSHLKEYEDSSVELKDGCNSAKLP